MTHDAALAAVFARPTGVPPQCVSGLEPWRDQIVAWRDQGIQGTTIHAALVRRYGYAGSYASELVKKLAKAVFLLPSFEETRPRHEGNDLHQILYYFFEKKLTY